MESTRTIQTILSLESGEQIEVDHLFKDQRKREAEIFQLRTKIEEQLQSKNVEYVCIYCKQPVALRGRKNFHGHSKHFYFTHPYKSHDCVIKTQSRLSEQQVRCIKYNGEKESKLHNSLKNLIGFYLQQGSGVSSVRVDKVYKEKAISKDWRKPDVLAVFNDKKIAFELQLSTTFLSVIVGRTIFYKQNDIFLIWVFPSFSLESDLQKFTQKDVYYNNNFNVYVFDTEAQSKSKEANELILRCYYKEFSVAHETITEKWFATFVKISDLTFNFHDVSVCFYDSEVEKKKALRQIETQKEERIKRDEIERTQRKIDRVVDYLKEFYKFDREPIPRSEEFPLDNIKSQSEISALDNRIKFTSEHISVIANLFLNRTKPNFLKLVCEQDNILVDTSKLSVDGKSIFEELLQLEKRQDFEQYTSYLFRKGYQVTEKDKTAIDNLYQKNFANSTEYEREQIDRWAIVNFHSKLTARYLSFDLMRIDKVLFAILSIKNNLVLGFRFNNHREITNYILEYRSQFGGFYIRAMEVYGQFEAQMKQDRTGKLKAKIDKFLADRPRQERKYDVIINDLFPELQVYDNTTLW